MYTINVDNYAGNTIKKNPPIFPLLIFLFSQINFSLINMNNQVLLYNQYAHARKRNMVAVPTIEIEFISGAPRRKVMRAIVGYGCPRIDSDLR